MDLFFLEKLWHSKWQDGSWQSSCEKEIRNHQLNLKSKYLNELTHYFEQVRTLSRNFQSTSPRRLDLFASKGADGTVEELHIFVGEAKAELSWHSLLSKDSLCLRFDCRGEASSLGDHKNKNYCLKIHFEDLSHISWQDQDNKLYFKKDDLAEFVLLELCKVSSYYEVLFEKESSPSQKDEHDRFF